MGNYKSRQLKEIIWRFLCLVCFDGLNSNCKKCSDIEEGFRAHEMPTELEEQIMVKLPVKSLLRFRCVCKLWNDLIKNQNFINNHLQVNVDRCAYDKHAIVLGYICANPSSESNEYAADYKVVIVRDDQLSLCPDNIECLTVPDLIENTSDWNDILACHCNGVLCLLNCLPGNTQQAVFYNPALRVHRSLIISPRPGHFFAGFGFGCDPITGNYKLVRILRPEFNLKLYKAEVYNLGTSQLKVVDLTWNNFLYSETGVLFKGQLFWIGDLNDTNTLLSFDLAAESSASVELPIHKLENDRSDKLFRLMVHNERLVFAVLSWDRNRAKMCCVDLWEAQEVTGLNWTKRTIRIKLDVRKVIAFWKNDQLLIEDREGRIMLYDLSSEVIKILVDSMLMLPFSVFGCGFVESLIFV